MNDDFLAKKFFLAANSPNGFVSRFDNFYYPEDGWFAYILKGGPGTGKSTLMKKIAKVAIESDIATELIYCSSDPNSLDGVIFSDLKVCIVDGTAPHTMDPVFPGVSDEIINLGDCWDKDSIIKRRDEIIDLTKKNSDAHKRAKRYLSSCADLYTDSYSIANEGIDEEKVKKYSAKLAKKLFSSKFVISNVKEKIRFVSGITPKGLVFFNDTIKMSGEKIYVLNDEYSTVSSIILSNIKRYAVNAGFNVTVCYCPMDPYNKIDCLMLPELSIVFVVSNSWHPINNIEPTQIINCKRFIDQASLSSRKQRLGFNKRVERELLGESIDNLKKAKSIHDDLEKIYCENMDYNIADKITMELINRIFNRKKSTQA